MQIDAVLQSSSFRIDVETWFNPRGIWTYVICLAGICGKRKARVTMGGVNMRIEVPSAGGPAKGRQARTSKSLNQDTDGTFNLDCIIMQ